MRLHVEFTTSGSVTKAGDVMRSQRFLAGLCQFDCAAQNQADTAAVLISGVRR